MQIEGLVHSNTFDVSFQGIVQGCSVIFSNFDPATFFLLRVALLISLKPHSGHSWSHDLKTTSRRATSDTVFELKKHYQKTYMWYEIMTFQSNQADFAVMPLESNKHPYSSLALFPQAWILWSVWLRPLFLFFFNNWFYNCFVLLHQTFHIWQRSDSFHIF